VSHRRPTRSVLAGLTLLVLPLALGACGSSAATPTPTSTATAVEITAAPTPTATTVTSAAPSEAAASGAPAASPAIIHGTTGEIVNETDGYTITLPDGWLRLDLSQSDLSSVMQSAGGMSDDLAALMQDQATTMALSGVHFWAVKTGEQAGYAPNANIIKQPAMSASLDLIEQLSVSQLESMDMLQGRKVAHQQVTLPSGQALQLRYEVGAKDSSSANVTATIVQYLVMRETGQYILTVTGLDGDAAAAAAESMATSWTFPS
jgi:hypothetical protein